MLKCGGQPNCPPHFVFVTRTTSIAQDLSHSATPPCREQAPRCVAACEYVPSLHLAVAFAASVFAAVAFATFLVSFTSDEADLLVGFVSCFAAFVSALVSAFAAFVSALASAFATFVFDFAAFADLSTPPWPDQVPRPVAVEVVPSLHVAAAIACAFTASGANAIAVATNNVRNERIRCMLTSMRWVDPGPSLRQDTRPDRISTSAVTKRRWRRGGGY